jgi:hypothetical protein
MSIDSFESLQVAEEGIAAIIKKYRLDHILTSIHQASNKLQPFVSAGIASFAIRNCYAGKKTKYTHNLEWNHLNNLARLVTEFLIADPIGFDINQKEKFYSSNPFFVILRILHNQLYINVRHYSQFARTLLLFTRIPRLMSGKPEIKNFDFEAHFRKINKVSTKDFVKVAFTAYAAAVKNAGFTRGYFEKAKDQGAILPSDRDVKMILGQLSAYPEKFNKSYEHHKNKDRLFTMYDFNPLFLYPIIRPWYKPNTKFVSMHLDRFITPLPELISYRISPGIFYQMFNTFMTKFSDYFGHIFEYYIGEVIKNSLHSSIILSEKEIRESYPEEKRKVPDWIVIEGKTAILFECKATRFMRSATSIGSEEAVNDSLKQVLKGLRQLYDFRVACELKKPGLEALHNCTKFKPVLITLEPLLLTNGLLREHIDRKLEKNNIRNFDWYIMPVDQLEILQPHFKSGISMHSIFERLGKETFADILDTLIKKKEQTFKDSFLYPVFEEMYQSLGVEKSLDTI